MNFRWFIPVFTRNFDYDWGGEKWKSNSTKQAEKILQYSLDGINWDDVESIYVEVHEKDIHKYKNWK